MNIVYLHGFGSRYNPESPKIQELKKIGNVSGFTVDYSMNAAILVGLTSNIISESGDVDLIVGTSMGGWLASQVGSLLGIPFVAVNPALEPSKSLQRHLGASTDYFGKAVTMTETCIESYKYFNTTGCGLILLDEGDEIFDSFITAKILCGHYEVKVFRGGCHRFDNMRDSLEAIAKFYRESELVYGS